MSNSVPLKGEMDKKLGAGFAPLSVQSQDTPNLTVKIRAGSFWTADGVMVEYAGGNSPSVPVPSTNPRWTLVSLTSTGSISLTHGMQSNAPSIPSPPADSLPLAAIYMTPLTTTITADRIMDVRPFARIVDTVPNIENELNDRPTFTDLNNALTLKADLNGTTSDTFTLNNDALVGTNAVLYVERGAATNVGIRWNETFDRWEFTNDGLTWLEMAAVSGTFMPLVSGAVAGNVAILNVNGEVEDSGITLSDLATDAEVSLKADTAALTTHTNDSTIHFTLPITQNDVSGLTTALDSKANLTGDTFTGNVVVDVVSAPALTVGEVSGTDVGLSVDRGVDPDAIIYWDEASDSWVAGVVGNVGTVVTEANFDAKADKVVSAVAGNLAGLDSTGNLTDSGSTPNDFATASQGSLADTALQPGDNISELINDVGYITSGGGAAEPDNQIVFGSGGGTTVSSDPNFTYNPANGALLVNSMDGITGSVEANGVVGVGIFSPDAVSGSFLTAPGIYIRAGDGDGTGGGGQITIQAGNGDDVFGSGPGGGMLLQAGDAGGGNNHGGNLDLQGGTGSGFGNGGHVEIKAGGTNTGTPGQVFLIDGNNIGEVVIGGGNNFDQVVFDTLIPVLPQYSVSALPTSSASPGAVIFVNDATPNPAMCFYNGTDWIDVVTGVAVV